MTWRVIVTMAIWWVAFNQASIYGGIWHNQAHPTRGVEVVLQSGESLTGDLSRNWDRSWSLTSSDGTARIFLTDDWRVLKTQAGADDVGYWQMWRAWGPVVLVTWLCVVALMWPMFRRLAITKRRYATAA